MGKTLASGVGTTIIIKLSINTGRVLAQLYLGVGKIREATDLLTPATQWTGDNFDSNDIKKLKGVLQQLN